MPDGRRIVVAVVVMLFLVVTSMAAIWKDDARRLEEVGRSVAADGEAAIVIPLRAGMEPMPIRVVAGRAPGARRLWVTLLDDRISGARRYRLTGGRYAAEAGISREFARYRVLRIAGDLSCVTGRVAWRNYEIATDTVMPAARSAAPLVRAPSDLPAALDAARTSLLCETR